MLDYLDLPFYERQLIYEFLQHQLAYEQHVKKFKACLDQLIYPADRIEYFDTNFMYKLQFWMKLGLRPSLDFYKRIYDNYSPSRGIFMIDRKKCGIRGTFGSP